jgi:hypothetical protein
MSENSNALKPMPVSIVDLRVSLLDMAVKLMAGSGAGAKRAVEEAMVLEQYIRSNAPAAPPHPRS